MKILSTEGLTKLIQLIKNSFISVNDTVTTDTTTLANVATTGDYNDLINTPNIPVYTAGEGIDITNNVISNTQTSAEWGNITGTLSNQTDLQSALNLKADTSSLSAVATSGLYSDLLGTPTIPTVNDATLTIQKNGTDVQTFTANASNNVTANIIVPTDTSDLTNGANYITASALTGYATETYVDTGLATKQATLVSGTNIKTINNNSILGSGNLTLDGLPTQTGQSGKFLTTDGVDASWGNLPVATSSSVGVVKPDNASIRVDNDGTLSVICRNVGEIISSTLPLTDAGLHLLDGSLILGGGIYQGFVDYIADLYNDTKVYNPSAFTVVGSPTITDDGIASGFASNNYLKTASTIDFGNSFELICKFVFVAHSSNQMIFATTTDIGVFCGVKPTTNKLYFRIGANNAWISNEISGITALTNGTNYYLKVTYTDGKYYVYISTDKQNWTQELSYTSATQVLESGKTLSIGVNRSDIEPFQGSIDLKQFSITVDGVEVFSGSNPANYFTDETTWQNSVTTYGVCGKFVYDSVNNTVRLPKYSNKIYTGGGTAPVVGNGLTLGLTDGINDYGIARVNFGGDTNALTSCESVGSNVGASYGGTNGTRGVYYGVSRNANNSGIIADLSNITTSLNGFYYIVIATNTKTEIEVDIDEIATDLNGKADVDLSNINASSSAKNTIIAWGMPDYANGITISTAPSQTKPFIAPSPGVLFLVMSNQGLAYAQIFVNGVVAGYSDSNPNSDTKGLNMMLSKNDSVYIVASNSTMSTSLSKFYPLKGAN